MDFYPSHLFVHAHSKEDVQVKNCQPVLIRFLCSMGCDRKLFVSFSQSVLQLSQPVVLCM